MGQSEKVKAFKNELRNYNYYLFRVNTLKNSIEFCYDRLGGVRGIDPSKEPTHAIPNKELEYKLRDDIERYEKERKRIQENILYIDTVLNRMEPDIMKAIISVYIYKEQVKKVADTLYLSHNGLQKRMNKAIEHAII